MLKKEMTMLTVNNTGTVNQSLLDDLAAHVSECHACPLASTRINTVFGRGSVSPKAVFIGEGPGENEDKQGLPFVGRAGQYLTKLLEESGIALDEIYITNCVKCRPPGNRIPSATEMDCCKQFLWRQLEILMPKIIVCVGNTSASLLLAKRKDVGKLLGDRRGQWIDLKFWGIGRPMCRVIHHPSYLSVYAPKQKGGPIDLTKRDLEEIRDKMAQQ